MEAVLFSLDVLFMVILVLGVVRREKKINPAPDLGFFSYAVTNASENVVRKQGKRRA